MKERKQVMALPYLEQQGICTDMPTKLGDTWCRCVLQLSALGYLLAPVFAYNTWWIVLLFAAAAVSVASAEAVSHPPAFYKVRQPCCCRCANMS